MSRIITLGTRTVALSIATAVAIAACGGATSTGIDGPGARGPDDQADAAPSSIDGSPTGSDGSALVDGSGDAVSPIATKASCAPDAGATGLDDDDPAHKRIVTGTNGAFEDACDSAGNLVKQLCDTRLICDAPPNPSCVSVQTGVVKPTNVDCAGLCALGACASDCPVAGDELEVKANPGDGNITFRNERDARTYACKLIFQQPNVAYDCKKAPFAGVTQLVRSLGLHGRYCTGKEFGNIGTSPATNPGTTQACTWSCDIIP